MTTSLFTADLRAAMDDARERIFTDWNGDPDEKPFELTALDSALADADSSPGALVQAAEDARELLFREWSGYTDEKPFELTALDRALQHA